MNRRRFLTKSSLAALGAGLTAGCGPRPAPAAAPQATPPRPPLALAPVKVRWDRVIRTTVGLRPHRPSGFVLRAERLDERLLVHNYGHGGAGMSLSWGTGALAADLALAQGDRRAAVLGCGAVGLASARQLQRRGFDVTIYAATVPPDTTSNMSLAGFTPTSGLLAFSRRTPAWDEQFRQAVVIAYRQLQLLAGSRYGVSWINAYTPTESAAAASGEIDLLPHEVRIGPTLLQPGEHPFPTTYAIETPFMRIEPSIYLDALVEDFRLFGGRVAIRKFDSPRDILSVPEWVIVNCTGLGAKAIFDDEELVPLKGQLTSLVPQPEVTYSTNGGLHNPSPQPGIGIHMLPRRDGIVLGGTSERDVWTSDVNEAERQRIVTGHMELFAAMRS